MPYDLFLPLRREIRKVLVPEDEHLALGGVERELVEALFAQVRDLDSGDLSAKVGGEVLELGFLSEETGELGVGARACVDVV